MNPKSLFDLAMNQVARFDAHDLLPADFDIPAMYDEYTRDELRFKSPVPILKHHLPKSLYTEYLTRHLQDNDFNWEEVLRDVVQCDRDDIPNWDMSNLTLEQKMLLQTNPEECLVEWVDDRAVLTFNSYIFNDNLKGVCYKCAKRICSPPTLIHSHICFKNACDIPTIIRSTDNWCSICKMCPLFTIEDYNSNEGTRKQYIAAAFDHLKNINSFAKEPVRKRQRTHYF